MVPENSMCIRFPSLMFNKQKAKFKKAFDVFQNDIML